MDLILQEIKNSGYSKTLESLFESEPQCAIDKSQKLICHFSHFDTFKDFLDYHVKHARISTCQNEWNDKRMAIHCFDCSVNPQSCVCLSCFLNGDHQGHNYIVRPFTIANCDCGDSSQWKQSGFCKKHKGIENNHSHPEEYIDEELRNILTNVVFKAAFSVLKQLSTQTNGFYALIFQFVSSFLQFGDGFRRLISISLTQKIDFEDLIMNITEYSAKFNAELQKFCGNLVNDQLFIYNFSKIAYNLIIEKVNEKSFQAITDNKFDDNYSIWNIFWFHAFTPSMIQYNIINNHWDWVSFAIQFSLDMKKFFTLIGNPNYTNNVPNYISEIIQSFSDATQIQPNEQTQLFFDRLFTEVLSSESIETEIETIVPVSYKDSREKNFYFPAQIFNLLFYPIFKCFKSKKNLKFDKMFEQLDKLIYVSPIYMLNNKLNSEGDENENDLIAMKYLKKDFISNIVYPSYYYESFHNGSSFYFSLPLYDALVSLFNLENMTKIKIARFLMNEKYQNLRVKLALITLKKILSFACFQQSLIPKNNFNLSSLILNFANSAVVASSGISKYFPLFQLLIGLRCNHAESNDFSLKEFFSFEMAREFGLFDDYMSDEYKDENIDEKYKQMVFCFLYYSILVIVERTLFNLNINDFIQEQLICALKNGASTLTDLMNSLDQNLLENLNSTSIVNSILSKIAIPRNKAGEEATNQEVSYILKDGINWKTVSAIIPIGDQKTLLNNEITKNQDKLLSIQEFEPEETFFFHASQQAQAQANNENSDDLNTDDLNVNLKDFLLTPTVLALTYHTLRSSSKNSSQNNDINDHFAMNVLVLISKFMKKEQEKNKNDQEKKKAPFDESTVIEYSSLYDLIFGFKEFVFNSKADEEGNVTIENTLNYTNFADLLKVKISYEKLPPLSFIDILQEKGKLGKEVFNQISEYLDINGFDTQDSTEKEKLKEKEKKNKKNRANKLKDEIMNHYKNLITNYTMNESDTRIGSSTSFGTVSSSGLINYEGDFCSVCSTIKKNEALSYPIFIYQTKFPFIIDKPPEAKEGEKLDYAVEITCDDDADFDCYNENDPEDDSDSLNHQVQLQQEIIHDSQLLNTIMQDIESGREAGTISNEELANRFQFVALMRQNVLFKMQMLQQAQYSHQFKENQKEIIEKRKELLEKEGNLTKGKRYTAGANFVLQFQVCQHLLHPNCIDSKVFNCPIDRSTKNGFLPCLESLMKPTLSEDKNVDKGKQISDSLSTVVKNSIQVFLSNFKSHISNDSQEHFDIFVELIKSISGLIATYEVRLRSLPDCLDSNNTKLLARNLFLTTWYAYRIYDKPTMCDKKPYTKPSFLMEGFERNEIDEDDNIEVEQRLTEFQKFVKKLIESDEIEDKENGPKTVSEIVDSFVKSSYFKQSSNQKRNEKELALFLRRVALADYFLLDNQNINIADTHPSGLVDFVDWDEILSASNLAERYNVKFSTLNNNEDFVFKPFTFANVPKEFLRFAQDPYNFPVEDTSHYSMFNLLDYNELIKNYNDFDDVDDDQKLLNNDSKNKNNLICVEGSAYNIKMSVNYGKKHYPAPFLFIGKNASKVAIFYQGKAQENLKPFYLDMYGSPDIGFKREQPLFLNEERYERFVDEVLSGSFIQ